MMRKKFTFMILFLLVLIPIASATVTVSTDQSGADLPDVMAERTFTITGSGWDGDCTSATLDLSECPVCSISENETKSITGSSVSWTTLTASKANSQKITVSVSGTCTPDSGYVSFNVKNPPSLTATVSPDSTSVTQGSTFSLSLNIQNNGETTANFGSITVSPSDFSISSGCSPSDISGGQSLGVSCTIAASGSATIGSRTLYIYISPSNADSVTKTVSVTVSLAGTSTTTTTPSGPGGGAGPSAPSEKKKSQTWTKMTPGSAEIMHVDDPDIGLKMINITVRNPVKTITITVTKLAGQPASVVHNVSGKVYKYIEITSKNLPDENVSSVKIQFQANKTWIIRNNINRATIALNRYHNNAWERLRTREVSEDSDFVYYEAESPGFSTFAVTGEEITTTTVVTTTIATTTVATTVKTTIPVIPPKVGGIPTWILGVIIIIIVAIVLLVWKFMPKKQRLNISQFKVEPTIQD